MLGAVLHLLAPSFVIGRRTVVCSSATLPRHTACVETPMATAQGAHTPTEHLSTNTAEAAGAQTAKGHKHTGSALQNQKPKHATVFGSSRRLRTATSSITA